MKVDREGCRWSCTICTVLYRQTTTLGSCRTQKINCNDVNGLISKLPVISPAALAHILPGTCSPHYAQGYFFCSSGLVRSAGEKQPPLIYTGGCWFENVHARLWRQRPRTDTAIPAVHFPGQKGDRGR